MKTGEGVILKPNWLKKRIPSGMGYRKVLKLLREYRLHTVCEEAQCPNLGECFSRGTATFMILGDRCTRNCTFCAVNHGNPVYPDHHEPEMIARAVEGMGLRYAVITSVTRDDLSDGGASHFARTIMEIRKRTHEVRVEILIPDFMGSEEAIRMVIDARPDVINHNIETVPRLYPEVRPQADYMRSLWIIQKVREINPDIKRKSGLILGLGEKDSEVMGTMEDLLASGCQILSIGQYLSPSSAHHKVVRYVAPEEFAEWKRIALHMGFLAVSSGPFVRSSYMAEEMFLKAEGISSLI